MKLYTRTTSEAVSPSQSEKGDVLYNKDADLLAQIGYKEELARRYSTLQIFGVAFSIMGLLPSIATTMSIGLESGPAGLVWGWLVSGFFIFTLGALMTVLGSSIPTSGGLYFYTHYFASEKFLVPLSFVIGCSNTLGLCGGICLILYGFAVQILSAVYVSRPDTFVITNAKTYGVFAAAVISAVALSTISTKRAAVLQTVSIGANVFIIILFLIAVPIGARKNGFNNGSFIFGKLENTRDWSQGWSFMLLWMPAVWTIGAYDSVIHCSEEAKHPQQSIPWGILGSISVCWIVGWIICIVCCACIKDGDTAAVLATDTGSVMAQIIYDALGKKWCIAFMALILVCQYLMGISIVFAASRQLWAFSRDDGFPVIYNWLKYVDPMVKEPIRAVIVTGILALLLGLLVLINGTAGSGALFSLAVACNMLSFGVPSLMVLLPHGRAKFVPGPFYLGNTLTTVVHTTAVAWAGYIIVMSMFPDNKEVDKDLMNYTVAINGGAWLVSIVYFYIHGRKVYRGPKSNLDSIDGEILTNLNPVSTKLKRDII